MEEMKLKSPNKALSILGIVFAILGAGFLIAAIFLTNYHIACINNWDECEATIIYINHNEENIKISYNYKSKIYQKTIGFYSSDLENYDKLMISVNPDNAMDIYLHDNNVFIVFYIIGGVFVIIGISLFCSYKYNEKNKNKCLEYGLKRICKNVGIVKCNTTVNNVKLYYFTVIYDGKKMKSESFYYDPRIHNFVNPVINVYLLENGKYYIDINSIREDEFSNF